MLIGSLQADAFVGSMAGLTTSLLWTATALFFASAGRRIGPTKVNAFRIALAILLHLITLRLITGVWLPEVTQRQVLYLGLSGIIGLTIGDQALFTALVDIGPRLSMMIMTTSPLFAAAFGWLVLGEMLSGWACIGIAMTVGGVGWVVLERKTPGHGFAPSLYGRGIALAFLAAACQAGGLLLSKQGIGHGWLASEQHLSPQAATLIRMVFAGVGMVPILLIRVYRMRRRRSAGTQPKRVGSLKIGLLLTACGSIVGPYLGVWMSLVASDRVPLGIAQTLCSLPPLFILPFVVVFYKERVSPRGMLGALVAVGGAAVLVLL